MFIKRSIFSCLAWSMLLTPDFHYEIPQPSDLKSNKVKVLSHIETIKWMKKLNQNA